MEQAQQNNVDNVSMVSIDEPINRNWRDAWNKLNKNNVDNVSMVSSNELINRNLKNEWNKLNKIMQTMSAWYPLTRPSTGIGRINGTSVIKVMRTRSVWYPEDKCDVL